MTNRVFGAVAFSFWGVFTWSSGGFPFGPPWMPRRENAVYSSFFPSVVGKNRPRQRNTFFSEQHSRSVISILKESKFNKHFIRRILLLFSLLLWHFKSIQKDMSRDLSLNRIHKKIVSCWWWRWILKRYLRVNPVNCQSRSNPKFFLLIRF